MNGRIAKLLRKKAKEKYDEEKMLEKEISFKRYYRRVKKSYTKGE